ncbi:MAG: DUF3987 domain-containing protein [Methylococcus sp.]|nr:DUF3987 domain-containing protein [Methylococcus sp.]
MTGQAAAVCWRKPRWRRGPYRNQFEAYVRYAGWKLCAIRKGTKAPTGKGWNQLENAIIDPDQAAELESGGALHAYSDTCALDIDDYQAAVEWFAERGINLPALLGAPDAVQIVSGKPNKAKLVYRLAAPRPSVKVTSDDGQVIFELRSGSADGLTVQDVLPPSLHPDTGQPYQWGGSGKWWAPPEIPAALLPIWDALSSSAPRRAERTPQHTAPVQTLDAAQLQDLREALYSTPSDGYDWWVKAGLALSGLGDMGRGLWMAWSATSEKFDAAVAMAKWSTFDGASADYRTIFAEAQRHGWTNPARERAARSRAPHPAEAGEPPEMATRQRAPSGQGEREGRAAERSNARVEAGPTPWPEPMVPAGTDVPNIPDILLPGWAGAMSEAVSASCQTPSAAAVMVTLAVVATCCQRRYEVSPHGSGYLEPLSLWTVTAMPPGSRKSAVMGALTQTLVRWEKLQRDRLRPEIARRQAARAIAEKRIEGLKKKAMRADSAEARQALTGEIQAEIESTPAELLAPRLFTNDSTPERSQQLLVENGEAISQLSDEGGGFQVMAGAYSGGMGSLDVYLQGHSGSAMRVDRGGRMAHLDRPAVTMGLMLQPGILAEVGKNRRFKDSGLLARFLYAIPPSNVGQRDVRQHVSIPEDIRQDWEAGLFRLLEGRTDPVSAPRTLTFGAGAKECWLSFAEEIERQHGAGNPLEHITEWTAKLPGAVARIAGLLHLAVQGPGVEVIGLDPVERATELGRLLIPHALAAFGLMGMAKQEEDAHALLRWIRTGQRRTFRARDAHQALRARFARKEQLDRALVTLEEWQVLLGNRQVPASERGGRPTREYLVNERALRAADAA